MSTAERRPVAIDAFAGVGGLGLGFEMAGFDVLAALEYDPVHAATHAYNLPGTEVLCRDATRVSGSDLLVAARIGAARIRPEEPWDGHVDAVIGGPPCQGFSSGGKRETGDERNALLDHFVRLVEEIRPTTFCLENVSGLLERRFDDVRERVLARLSAAGYSMSGSDTTVDAAEFGVPQRRRRVILLGSLDGEPGRPSTVDRAVTVRDAFDGLPDPQQYPDLLRGDQVRLNNSDLALMHAATSTYARRLSGIIDDPTDLSVQRRVDRGQLTSSRRTAHRLDTAARFAQTLPGSVEPVSRFYRLPLDGASRTLRAGTGAERGAHTSPRPIHPTSARVITAREAARLHGYPDWFRFHTTNWHAHRQIGNSVPPPLAQAAGRALVEALGVRPSRHEVLIAEQPDERLLTSSRLGSRDLVDTLVDHLPKGRTRGTPAA